MKEKKEANVFSEISERVSMGGLVLFNYLADIGLLSGSFLEAEYMAAMDKFDPNELANDKGKGLSPGYFTLRPVIALMS
jgi:hypothetical protein